MALLAALVIINVLAYRASRDQRSAPSAIATDAGFKRFALSVTVIVYLQLLIGGYVRHTDAGLACLDFPFCNVAAYPAGAGLQLLHRLVGVVAAALIGWLARRASRLGLPRSLLVLAHGAFALALIQIGLGAWSVWSRLAVPVTTAHLGVAAVIFALLVALSVQLYSVPVRATSSRDAGRVSA
jgi:heme A synthase